MTTVKAKTAAAPTASAAAPEAEAERTNRAGFSPEAVITLVDPKAANPKREGTKSHARYELYKGQPTVAAYCAAAAELEGGKKKPYAYLADLHWDTQRGRIEVA